MKSEKRYTVTIDAYIYAVNEDDAKIKAKESALFLDRDLETHSAQVIGLHSTPFGSMACKLIELFKTTKL